MCRRDRRARGRGRAAQGLEQAELVGAPESGRGEALELRKEPFSCGLTDPACRRPHQLLRRLVEAKAEFVLEAHRAQESQWVILEDRRRNGPQAARLQVVCASERVDQRAAVQGPCERVHGEVPGGQVVLDRLSVERREVVRAPVPEGNTPGPVPLREQEDCATGQARVDAGRQLWARARDVHVHDLPAEKLVAQRSAHDPRRLVADGSADALIHRRGSIRPWYGSRFRPHVIS